MSTKRFEKTFYNEDLDETVVIATFVCEFESNVLNIYRAEIKDDSTEVLELCIVQPWKNNNNQSFVDAEDAFNWFETNLLDTLQ